MTKRIVLAAWLVGACGSDEPAPSCQQSVTNYYGAGCRLIDLSTGLAEPVTSVIADCKGLIASAPAGCIDELDNLRRCWGAVPIKSTLATTAECDCSVEQDAVLACR